MRTTRSLPPLLAVAAVAVLPSLLGACGGGGGSGAGDIASLGGEATTTTDDGGGGGGGGGRRDDAAFQDAMLEYAECMRGEGVDMPDPQTQDGGGVVIMAGPGGPGGGPPDDADVEAFEAADETCRPIIEEAVGELEPPSPEEQERMRENALEFAECMRDHGIDMPDPQIGEGGDFGIAVGSDDADGGARPGGIDPMDEDFQEAAEKCGGETGFGATVIEGAGEDE